MDNSDTSVKVAVRIRPLNEDELQHEEAYSINAVAEENQIVAGTDTRFTFDYVFNPEVTQSEIYDDCVVHLVNAAFEGFNATILAYGQTGSGKTYTMGSSKTEVGSTPEIEGIIPRVIEYVFEQIKCREEADPNCSYRISVQFLEIYGEDIRDLLDQTKTSNVTIRETREDGVFVSGAREEHVSSYAQMMKALEDGTKNRTTAATKMNLTSSRSHAIFTVVIENTIYSEMMAETTSSLGLGQLSDAAASEAVSDDCSVGQHSVSGATASAHEVRRSKFHFVDLAGSERAKRTGAQGLQLKEGIDINKGLLALGNVISALGDDTKRGKVFVPYRDSKLTRMLQDSLGGNSKTLMICCVSPSVLNYSESVNALRYANRARNIKNKPVVNRDPTLVYIDELRFLLQRVSKELLDMRKCKQFIEPAADTPVTEHLLEGWAEHGNGAILGIAGGATASSGAAIPPISTRSASTTQGLSSRPSSAFSSPTQATRSSRTYSPGRSRANVTAAAAASALASGNVGEDGRPPFSPTSGIGMQHQNSTSRVASRGGSATTSTAKSSKAAAAAASAAEINSLKSRLRDSDFEIQRLTNKLKHVNMQMSEAEDQLLLAKSEGTFYRMKWAEAAPEEAKDLGALDMSGSLDFGAIMSEGVAIDGLADSFHQSAAGSAAYNPADDRPLDINKTLASPATKEQPRAENLASRSSSRAFEPDSDDDEDGVSTERSSNDADGVWRPVGGISNSITDVVNKKASKQTKSTTEPQLLTEHTLRQAAQAAAASVIATVGDIRQEKKQVMAIVAKHLREIDSLKRQLAEAQAQNSALAAVQAGNDEAGSMLDVEFTANIATLMTQAKQQLRQEHDRLKDFEYLHRGSTEEDEDGAVGSDGEDQYMLGGDSLSAAEAAANDAEDEQVYVKRQKMLSSEVEQLGQSIVLKEQLMAQLNRSQQQYTAMKAFYEQKLQLLGTEVAEKQSERDKLLTELGEVSDEKDLALVAKETREKQLKDALRKKDEELRVLKRKQDDLSRMSQVQSRYNAQMSKLEADVTAMKKQRVELTKTQTAEKKSYMQALQAKAKEIDRLKRELNKSSIEVRKLGRDKMIAEARVKDAVREGAVFKKKTQDLLKASNTQNNPQLAARMGYRAARKITAGASSNRMLSEEELKMKRWIDRRVAEIAAREKAADSLKAHYEQQLQLLQRKKFLESERSMTLEGSKGSSSSSAKENMRGLNRFNSSAVSSGQTNKLNPSAHNKAVAVSATGLPSTLETTTEDLATASGDALNTASEALNSSGDTSNAGERASSALLLSTQESEKLIEIEEQLMSINGELDVRREQINSITEMFASSADQVGSEKTMEMLKRTAAGSLPAAHELIRLLFDMLLQSSRTIQSSVDELGQTKHRQDSLRLEIDQLEHKLAAEKSAHDEELTTAARDYEEKLQALFEQVRESNEAMIARTDGVAALADDASVEPLRLQLAITGEESKFLRNQLNREGMKFSQLQSRHIETEQGRAKLARETKSLQAQIEFLEADRALFKELADDLKAGLQSMGKQGKAILGNVKDRSRNKKQEQDLKRVGSSNKLYENYSIAGLDYGDEEDDDDDTESVLGEFEHLAMEINRTGGVSFGASSKSASDAPSSMGMIPAPPPTGSPGLGIAARDSPNSNRGVTRSRAGSAGGRWEGRRLLHSSHSFDEYDLEIKAAVAAVNGPKAFGRATSTSLARARSPIHTSTITHMPSAGMSGVGSERPMQNSIYDRLTNPSNYTGAMKLVFENDLEQKRKKTQQIRNQEKSNPQSLSRREKEMNSNLLSGGNPMRESKESKGDFVATGNGGPAGAALTRRGSDSVRDYLDGSSGGVASAKSSSVGESSSRRASDSTSANAAPAIAIERSSSLGSRSSSAGRAEASNSRRSGSPHVEATGFGVSSSSTSSRGGRPASVRVTSSQSLIGMSNAGSSSATVSDRNGSPSSRNISPTASIASAPGPVALKRAVGASVANLSSEVENGADKHNERHSDKHSEKSSDKSSKQSSPHAASKPNSSTHGPVPTHGLPVKMPLGSVVSSPAEYMPHADPWR